MSPARLRRLPLLLLPAVLGALLFASHVVAAEAPMLLPGMEAAGEPCAAEQQLEASLARDPEVAARRALLETLVAEAQAKGLVPKPGDATNANVVYTIPVAVHIVHGGGAENIPYAQVLSQIAAINRDCQNLPGNVFPAADCQMQFCLATILPQGSAVQWANANEPGVTRTQSAQTVVSINNDVALKAIDYLPSTKYLNVWVVKRILDGNGGGGIVGYATFPGSVPAHLDGIVMDYRVMGANNTGNGFFPTLLPTYDEGKVFAHEVGHWLDLFHTFHGGCSVGDQVGDTPPEGVNATLCPSVTPSTCTANGGDPIHNFMDYTNDPCRWQFTAGQKTRMFAAISTYRSTLVSNPNLVATGACAPSLFALVTPATTQACVNVPIPCSAPNCGGSCTYTWSFPGGTPATSNVQNPSVTYTTPGVYTATVTLFDGTNSSTASATIYVSACTPITGTCTNWVWSRRCRLDFSSGKPVGVSGTVNLALETASQVSNAAGQLQFYSDGSQVFTATNVVMPNGSGIIGGNSAHMGSLVLPVPGSSTKYYLFSVRHWEDGAQNDPLHYSVVDMTLNGGLGDVVGAQKNVNIPLPGTPQRLIEGMTLIPHCNATDWWLITHGAENVNENTNNWNKYIYVTLITSAGAGASTAYPIGLGGAGTNYSAWGALTASRDASKFAVIQSKSEAIGIYTIDRSTGAPTLQLNTGDIDANHDVAFSPNGKVLYYCYLKPGTNNQYGLRQYDLATQQVRTITTPLSPGGDLDVRLGPDDKIYIGPSFSTTLHCVNFPDQFNVLNQNECGFNPYSVPLGGIAAMTEYATLPNILPVCSASAQPASFTATVTNCMTWKFTSPNCGPWNWTFGDGGTSTLAAPTHVYASPGTYTVTLTAPSASPSVFQTTITVGNLPVSIAGPNQSCGGPFNYSAVGPSNYVYTWTITGGTPTTATGNNVFVSWGLNSGTVQLTATDPATGCVSNAFIGVEACMNCTKPPLDMIAWWPLDEAGGLAAQDIVSANDGVDAAVGSPAKVPAAVQNGRQFDGSTGVIRVNDDPKLDLGTGDLTIDAWVRTSSLAPLQGIVEKRLLAPDRGYALYLKQGRLALLLGDGSSITEFWASSSASLADGAWHHVAATENRADNAAGTKLYVDGTLVATFAGYSAAANLVNSEKLVIGAQEPAATPTGWFAGSIDEVEIFSRALSADEVAKVWGAGPAGKCKEFVATPAISAICSAQGYAFVTLYVCNHGTTAQSFNLGFSGSTGPGCNGPAPSAFAMLGQNNPIPVPPGSCFPVTLQITRPAGLTNGLTGCYAVTATNVSTGIAHVTSGRIKVYDSLCPILTSAGEATWGGVGTPIHTSWTLRNTSPSFQSVPVRIDVRPADAEEPQPVHCISLNGLPPGVPWLAEWFIAPQDSAVITVEAAFTTPRPFRTYDLVLSIDPEHNFEYEDLSSALLFQSDRLLPVVAVPPAEVAAPITDVRLLPVLPNPFTRRTRVMFDLPRPGWLRLGLYDVKGRRVRRIAEGMAEAGRGSRALDATGLASGVYLVRLETQGVTRTTRVVLLAE